MTTRRGVAAAGRSAAVLLLAAACGGGEQADPRLVVLGGERGMQLGIPRVPPGATWVVQGVMICTDGEADVALGSVRAIGATPGVEALDFAVRDNPLWRDGDTWDDGLMNLDVHGTLEEAGFDRGEKTVTHLCAPGTGQAHEIGIELRAPDAGAGHVEVFEVTYGHGSATIPISVVLCPYQTASDPRCEPPANNS